MDCVGNSLPALYLFFRPDSGAVWKGDCLGVNPSTLGDLKSGVCTLGIVLRHQLVGNQARVGGATTGHRRHDDAVFVEVVSGLERDKKTFHKRLQRELEGFGQTKELAAEGVSISVCTQQAKKHDNGLGP